MENIMKLALLSVLASLAISSGAAAIPRNENIYAFRNGAGFDWVTASSKSTFKASCGDGEAMIIHKIEDRSQTVGNTDLHVMHCTTVVQTPQDDLEVLGAALADLEEKGHNAIVDRGVLERLLAILDAKITSIRG
jgi:hypothetical protein